MRVASQSNIDLSTNQTAIKATAQAIPQADTKVAKDTVQPIADTATSQFSSLDKDAMKEKLEPAMEVVNELLNTTNKAAKFVLHEGLDKYYVRLVDAQTEEVIKEIPPESLLNAFYELQKMAGMIVDEKI